MASLAVTPPQTKRVVLCSGTLVLSTVHILSLNATSSAGLCLTLWLYKELTAVWTSFQFSFQSAGPEMEGTTGG